MSTESSEGELISSDDAFAMVRAQLGITTWKSFLKWREIHEVRSVRALRLAEVEEALAQSRTREQSNKSRGTK